MRRRRGNWRENKYVPFSGTLNYLNVAFISYKLTMWDLMLYSDGRRASRSMSTKNRNL